MSTHEVHRYTDSGNANYILCVDCATRQGQTLTIHEGVATACSMCTRKYFGVWSRWQPLIGSRTATDPPLPIAELQRFATEARLDFNRVEVSGRDPNVYIGHHGKRQIAFPCVKPELMNDSARYLRWRDAFRACMWFMPAFITNGELENGWYSLWDCSESERTGKFNQLMHELYTARRQARSILHYYNLREFTTFRPAIVDALKAAHLGLLHASTCTLIIVVEGVLKEIRSSLGLPPPPPNTPVNIPQLVEDVFDGAYSKICSYRGYSRSGGYNWIPEEYTGLECMARQDDYIMFLTLFKEFLLRQLFANTVTIDMADSRVLNRHAIAHGIAPARGIVLDTIKLIGVLDGLASIIGQVTDQQFGLYGKFHGAYESRGICHEPGTSIETVETVFRAFHALSVSPVWVALVRGASEIMDGIARDGTVIPTSQTRGSASTPSLAPPPPPASDTADVASEPTAPSLPHSASDAATPSPITGETSNEASSVEVSSGTTATTTMAASTSER